MPGRHGQYPPELRKRAAQLVLDGRRRVRDVAGELGINHQTRRHWVAAGWRPSVGRSSRSGPGSALPSAIA
jgi:transposase-like protein